MVFKVYLQKNGIMQMNVRDLDILIKIYRTNLHTAQELYKGYGVTYQLIWKRLRLLRYAGFTAVKLDFNNHPGHFGGIAGRPMGYYYLTPKAIKYIENIKKLIVPYNARTKKTNKSSY